MSPILLGKDANGALATEFAREVYRVHKRYANEVVLAFGLCPFLRDAESGLGSFYVWLDSAPDLEACEHALSKCSGLVAHLVFPRVDLPAASFERFTSQLSSTLRARKPQVVTATFHPELSGDLKAPHRLVGALRRAPDPFLQVLPDGIANSSEGDHEKRNFELLSAKGAYDEVASALRSIREDRDRSYQRFLSILPG